MELTKEMYDHFEKRTKMHIDLVNKYGAIVGKDYKEHDKDKYGELKEAYVLVNWRNKIGKDYNAFSKREQALMNSATKAHIFTNAHHPESALRDIRELDGFDRADAEKSKGKVLDCTAMTTEGIIEMCADWCAMSEELGNTPFEWADKNIDIRWKFDDRQKKLINRTLRRMWR